MSGQTGEGAPNTPFEERSIQGKVAVVTGGSRGIGAQLVRELAKRGATVVVVARDQKRVDQFVEQVKQETGNQNIDGRVCDQGKREDIIAFFDSFKNKYSHIDILVNNAGIMPGFGMEPSKISDELDEETFRINTEGAYFFTKYALPFLFAAPGDFERTVLFTSSAAGWLEEPEPGWGFVAYRASKAAEQGIMVGLHQLYVDDHPMAKQTRGSEEKKLHRVVTVHPGFVATTLGLETAGPVTDLDAYATDKLKFGAIPVSEGADTLLWVICAKNGVVQSGKHYYLRKVHSF